MITRLGRELVTRKEIAVAELIKNAYDADATQVEVTFQNAKKKGGTLIIDDDGHGMSRTQLLSGFMRLASPNKVEQPRSPKYNRIRAGRKGIGRFATQRLGRHLQIYTQQEQAKRALKVAIDWTRFEANRELSLISQEVWEVLKTKPSGTTLIIDDLEETWDKEDIQRVYRYIANLQQPFPLSKDRSGHDDPGFDVIIFQQEGETREKIASVEQSVYEYALAEIRGAVDEQGRGKISYMCKKYDLDVQDMPFGKADEHGRVERFSALRNVRFVAYYYIENELAPGTKTLLRKILKDKGGIRVYRNGFRVPPYGDLNNDWLDLDSRSARRQILPPFSNRNFLGFVEIIDVQGKLFNETSSREGLIQNDAFNELRRFVGDALEKLAIDIGNARGKKVKPTKSQQPPSPVEQIKNTVENFQRSIESLTVALEQHDELTPEEIRSTLIDVKRVVEETSQKTDTWIAEYEKAQRVTLAEIEMLRILASLGLAIGEFTHEIKTLFPSVKADANNILAMQSLEMIHETTKRMKQNLETLSAYLAYFDKSIAENVRRDTKPLNISKVLYSFYEVVVSSASNRGIVVYEPEILGGRLCTTPMHPSEWSSILFNLYTNAYKAIRRAGREPGKILLRAGRENDTIFVEFADNGTGIGEKDKDRIFEAFFTTSRIPDPMADPMDGLQGAGLGLKIVKDIIETRKGRIFLADAPEGYKTNFRIEIPAASPKDLRGNRHDC